MSGPTLTPSTRDALIACLPRLRRFARSLAGSEAAGDDLSQMAIERALARMAQFQPGTRLDSWLFRIARNIWIDERRSLRGRAVAVSESALDGHAALSSWRTIEDRDTLAKTESAITRLSEDHRAVVALVLVDGLTYREAAEVLQIPIGTVMSRLQRARTILHKEVYG